MSRSHHFYYSTSERHWFWLQQVICGSMLVPLVRLLADPVEKCRDGALVFLASAAEQLPDPAALLSCLVPAVAGRMGDMPVAEPSEELRLAIIRLIAGPVILRSGQDLLPYLTMIVKVVCRALEDPFHEIKKVCLYQSRQADIAPGNKHISTCMLCPVCMHI